MNAPSLQKSHFAGIGRIWLIAVVALFVAPAPPAWSALISRSILKSFFEKGDKPTAPQFSTLIDSLLHRTEDRDLLGLKAASDGGGDHFTEGELIGPHLTFTDVAGLSDIWAGQSGFLPLAFVENSDVYYGYMQLQAGDPGSPDLYPMFVEYFVYEDQPGVPIIATTVPEPSSLLLGAAGFALLAASAVVRRWKRG